MTRLLFGLTLAAAVGCTGFQAVGPITARQGKGGGKPDPTLDGPAEPVVIPAATPPLPKCIVHPEDVTEENVDVIRQKLLSELEADRKNMPAVPQTAEISRYKDGVKE
jgi:hypothetical protein